MNAERLPALYEEAVEAPEAIPRLPCEDWTVLL